MSFYFLEHKCIGTSRFQKKTASLWLPMLVLRQGENREELGSYFFKFLEEYQKLMKNVEDGSFLKKLNCVVAVVVMRCDTFDVP